jgi:hypothetical protein
VRVDVNEAWADEFARCVEGLRGFGILRRVERGDLSVRDGDVHHAVNALRWVNDSSVLD